MDHPLVGRIWDARAGTFVTPATLFDRAAAHRHVLLGEKHDNPDHHRLQARVIRELVERGRRPAVVFEMISVDHSAELAQVQREHPGDLEGLRAAVDWDAGGWDWEMYRPVLQAALDNGLEVFAGNVPVDYVTRLRVHRLGPDPGPGRPELGIPEGVPADVRETLRQEIEDAHCGFAQGAILPMMVDLQHARDVHLARKTEEVHGFREPGDRVRGGRGRTYRGAGLCGGGGLRPALVHAPGGRDRPLRPVPGVAREEVRKTKSIV